MLKTPILLFGFLFTGIGIGWLLHEFIAAEPAVNFNQEATPVVRSETAGYSDDTANTKEQPPVLEVQANEAVHFPENRITALLEAGDFSDAVALCRERLDYFDNCRRRLMSFSQRNISTSRKIQLLDAWLTERPDDLEAGLDFADALVKDRQYARAIQSLESIRSYQVDADSLGKIARLVKSMVRSTRPLFLTNGRPEALASLYRLLVETEPQNAKWRYELAVVLVQLEQQESAISLLSYILFDAEYGDRATKLHQEITQRLAFADQIDVPVIKQGSQFLVEALINGTTPAVLLIDTGASITSIDKKLLTRAGISMAGKPTEVLQTANGAVDTTLVRLNSLRIGTYTASNVQAASIGSLGRHFDGLLGMDVLGRFKFSIDEDRRVLLLTAKNH